jgi:predicted nucleic acid-binding protein
VNIVIDASMALAWIFERQKPEEARLADQLLLSVNEHVWLAPALLQLEIANALLVGERRKAVSEAQVVDFLHRFDQLPIRIDGDGTSVRRAAVMALAREYGLSAYDATYLELALRSGASLATFDTALARAVNTAGGSVFRTA